MMATPQLLTREWKKVSSHKRGTDRKVKKPMSTEADRSLGAALSMARSLGPTHQPVCTVTGASGVTVTAG